MNSRRRFMGEQLKAKIYELLEYIESTGTQSIYLGSIPFNTDNTTIEADFQYTEIATGSDAKWLFSNQTSSSNIADFYSQVNSTGATGFHVRPSGTSSSVTVVIPHDTNRHQINIDYIHKKIYFDDQIYTMSYTQSSQTAPMHLFRRSNVASGYAKIKLYSFKYNRTVHHDYNMVLLPAKRLSDNAIGLLDTLTNTFYANAGSGIFIGQSKAVPEYVYEKVEKARYIEATGTQYFYTNINASFNLKCEIDADFYAASSQCGCDDLLLGLNTISDTVGRYIARIGKNGTVLSKEATLGRHTLILDAPNNTFTVDGSTSSVSRGSTPTSTNFTILARRGTSGDSYQCQAKLYRCRIWVSGVLQRDFIPVKYGNEYCVLDKVNKILYHNNGTGSFIGG